MHVLNYIEEGVDIYSMPGVHEVLRGMPGDEILIGDLHANSMKFFYYLIRHGVISGLAEEEYQEIVTICTKRADELTESELEYFKLLLGGLTYNCGVIVNLGGDNVFDKCKSPDFFVMSIVRSLIEHGVTIKNYISNHDVELAELSELGLIGDDMLAPRLSTKDYHSFRETAVLLKRGLVTKQELLDLYNGYYKTTFRALGRFVDTSGKVPRVFIVSHAAIDLNTIKKEADYLEPDQGHDVNYFPQLMKTMDTIDRKFRLVVDGNWIHDLYDQNAMKEAYKRRCDLREHPFVCSMWNRDYDSLDRTMVQDDYDIYYIHGHDDWDPGAPNCCNLNNNLGKTLDNSKGQYSIIYVTNHDLPPSVDEDYQFFTGKVVTAVREAELESRRSQQSFEEDEIESERDDGNAYSTPLRKTVATLQQGRLLSCERLAEGSESDSTGSEMESTIFSNSYSPIFLHPVRGYPARQQNAAAEDAADRSRSDTATPH